MKFRNPDEMPNAPDQTPAASKAASDALFDKCVQTVLRKDGTMLICCKLGLWSCSGRDYDQVKQEARHYFALYHADGEYDEILSNGTEQATASRHESKGGSRI